MMARARHSNLCGFPTTDVSNSAPRESAQRGARIRAAGCVAFAAALTCQLSSATVIYSQPHNGTGTLYQSSWWDPDDSDWDIHTWDSFILPADHAISEITWRGGYIYGGSYTPSVVNFTVAIYPSIAGGSQPNVLSPLAEYETAGNASQTPAGTYGGAAMYDYHFTLPSPFQASANTKYWLYILAWQNGVPEWGFAAATGGNGSHFRFVRGIHMYQNAPGDLAFTLISPDAPTFTINASVSPASAGTVFGAGAYPEGSTATLTAYSNQGWGFQEWTESSVVVSTSAQYSFPVTADRTLLANFVPAYAITTGSSPYIGGTTAGGGVFNTGTSATVTATPNHGFVFVSWTEFGSVVSTDAAYSFVVGSHRSLVANFAPAPQTVVFDFDTAPLYTSLPIDLTAGGITAHLSATGQGYSIQHANAYGFTPAGFAGRSLYPNGIFAADLLVSFSRSISDFSILYSPQELGCDDSALMRVSAYLGGAFVGTATATAQVPGTWPSETLAINLPGEFDSVVVHYDAHPPTCQDWGPIFLADNMTVQLAAPPCPADLNGDGVVDLADLATLLANFGTTAGAAPEDGDLDGDGDVDLSDLSLMLANYGAPCV